jgi:shikimate dehydrogenase
VLAAPRVRLGVFGWPVAHSRSPAMHTAALRAAGLDGWSYQRLPVPPELFTPTARVLGAAGFRGANVTIPHKEAALALAHEATAAARAIGAANTLTYRDDGAIEADNTDAPGLLEAIGDAPRASAVVLGAGGTARAVVWALREAGAHVRVWNRTPERAAALGVEVLPAGRALPGADLLVNCTSVGLGNPSSTFKDLPISPDSIATYATVVDLVYRPGGTALELAARERGVPVVGGLEILVRQGARSFTTWTGRTADLDVMRRAVADPHDRPDRTTHPGRRPGGGDPASQ